MCEKQGEALQDARGGTTRLTRRSRVSAIRRAELSADAPGEPEARPDAPSGMQMASGPPGTATGDIALYADAEGEGTRGRQAGTETQAAPGVASRIVRGAMTSWKPNGSGARDQAKPHS